MSAFNYKELKRHVGHDIVCVEYANGVNVAIECETCNEVLLDYDEDNGGIVMSKDMLAALLNNELSPEKVKEMPMLDFQSLLIEKGVVASEDDLKMLVIESVQNAAIEDDEFPIRYYTSDEEIPEENRIVKDAGEMLTDNYIEQNLKNS